MKIFIIIIPLVIFSCSRRQPPEIPQGQEPEEKILAVEALTVGKGKLVPLVETSGIIRGVNEAWVVSETSGIIQNVFFEIGDTVKTGEVLLQVEDTLAKQARDLAEQQYTTARLDFDAAEKSYQRGGLSMIQFSQTKDRFLAAQNAYHTAEKNYQDTALRAPFSGKVAQKAGNTGEGNFLNRGLQVARIIDDGSFIMQAGVGEKHVQLIQPGLPALIETLSGDLLEGKVKAVSVGSDEATGSYGVILEWAHSEEGMLRPGMSAHVSIETLSQGMTILVPSSAVLHRGGQAFVYLEEGGKTQPRNVTLGERLGERQQILTGLQEGETLIISALNTLSAGSPVAVDIIGNSGQDL